MSFYGTLWFSMGYDGDARGNEIRPQNLGELADAKRQ